MGKRIISILLMMCLCISVLAGCGASGETAMPAGTTADNAAAQESSQRILGIIGDATLSSEQADVEALCESCGVDFWGYADYTWLASDKEKASGDAISLIADYGCTTIIFAVKGTEQIDLNFIQNMELKDFVEKDDFLPMEGEKNASAILREGDFLICYPSDGHRTAVQVGEPETIKKAIFKVKI